MLVLLTAIAIIRTIIKAERGERIEVPPIGVMNDLPSNVTGINKHNDLSERVQERSTKKIWTKRPLYTVVISYMFFALSPIMDLLDILARAGKDDTAGILDIYPTFFKGYIVLLTIITVINVLGIRNRENVEV